MDAKAKQKAQDSIKYENLGTEVPKNDDNFIVGFLKALWGFKAGLFMMGVSFCWYLIQKKNLYRAKIY